MGPAWEAPHPPSPSLPALPGAAITARFHVLLLMGSKNQPSVEKLMKFSVSGVQPGPPFASTGASLSGKIDDNLTFLFL